MTEREILDLIERRGFGGDLAAAAAHDIYARVAFDLALTGQWPRPTGTPWIRGGQDEHD